MKSIIFPTDFSNNAGHALRFALKIAERSKSKLILFHAFWVPVYEKGTPPEMKTKEKNILGAALKELKKIQKDIMMEYPSVETEILIRNTFTADGIVEAAELEDASLIVMGTKGASGLKGIIMGSNTVDVIHKAKKPVLVVPENTSQNRFSKFVFATDFHDQDIEKIGFLITLATLFDAEVTIVHVTEDDLILETADKAILQHLKKDAGIKTGYDKLKYKLLKGDVIEELEGYLRENNADLVVVVNSRRQFLTRVFSKSITQQMAFHSKVPLLVLHK